MGDLLYQFLGSLGGTLILYGMFKIAGIYRNEWTSPIRDLPGPKRASWLWGNFLEMRNAVCIAIHLSGRYTDFSQQEQSLMQEKWVEQYGMTIKYHGPFGVC